MSGTRFDMFLSSPGMHWPATMPECWGCTRRAKKQLVVKYDDGSVMLFWCGSESCVPSGGKNPVDTATSS